MERKKGFCNTALGNGTGMVAFCENASLQQGKGVRKSVFSSSFGEGLFGRMRLQGKLHLLPPFPCKHQHQ